MKHIRTSTRHRQCGQGAGQQAGQAAEKRRCLRSALATLVAALACSACSVAGQAGPVLIEFGTSFKLRPGETAQVADGSWRVGLEGVTADSRCPKGEQCVWAGDATVSVWLQQGAGSRQTHLLHTAPGAVQAVQLLGHELRLLQLEPYPVGTKLVSKADHVATLVLKRGPATVHDR